MTFYCFNCGEPHPGGFMATEDIASVMCDECGAGYNVDDINGDLDF